MACRVARSLVSLAPSRFLLIMAIILNNLPLKNVVFRGKKWLNILPLRTNLLPREIKLFYEKFIKD